MARSGPVRLIDRGCLGAAGLDALTADVSDDSSESPTLSIGPLPPEFEAVSQPQSRGYETISATLSVGHDNFDISVSTWNPIVGMAMAGPLRSVEIAGGAGWSFLSAARTQDVTWQVDDSTFVYLKVNDGSDLNRALDLAADIEFVDWATFAGTYDVEELGSSSSTVPD